MPTPFHNQEFTFTNPDGSTLLVRGTGDQHYAVFETLDGYTVAKDPESGFFHYARLSEDKNDLLPSGPRVNGDDPGALGLDRHLRITKEAAKHKALEAPMKKEVQTRWEIRRKKKKQELKKLMPTTDLKTVPRAGATVGNYVGLCLLIEFPDVSPTIPKQEVVDFCNKPGYSGFSNNGSVRDYFHDISHGRFTYTNVVTEYYTAANDRSYYTDPSISYGSRARELIIEALDHLKDNRFDFSDLSSDQDGFIYALNVFYVGLRVNNWAEGLWPHAWALASPYKVAGGKKFHDYQITNMGSELTLRTFCHENGHMVCDYPDLYDYGGESKGVGHYCLMCYGGSSKNPVQVGAYLKNESGWATKAETIKEGTNANLSAGNNDFYIHAKNATEYFIIENRQKSGRDTALPDDGLAIWHVDENGTNNDEHMTPSRHYECSLEQEDNRFDLEKNVNAGDASDLFAAPGRTKFSDTTAPDSKWWDGTDSGLNITQISQSGPTMTFKVPAKARWVNNKLVRYAYAHSRTKQAFAIIESLDGWKRIAPASTDGVSNVLDILKAAKANGKRVNVYVSAKNQIEAVVML